MYKCNDCETVAKRLLFNGTCHWCGSVNLTKEESTVKLDTEEKKLAYLLGYVQALAEQHAREFSRDISEVKKDLLEQALTKKK